MAVSYKKLWHILLDRDENVSTEVLEKICSALNCTTDDIMEFVPDEK